MEIEDPASKFFKQMPDSLRGTGQEYFCQTLEWDGGQKQIHVCVCVLIIFIDPTNLILWFSSNIYLKFLIKF